jgi:hypothetical protein
MSVINRIHPDEAAPVSKEMLWAGRIMTALGYPESVQPRALSRSISAY